MQKVLIGIQVVIILASFIVVTVQLSQNTYRTSMIVTTQDQNSQQIAQDKATPAQLDAAKKAAAKISEMLGVWYSKNKKSYANFATDADNARQMRVLFGSLQTTLDYFQYSSKSDFVVRTHVPGAEVEYCTDKTSEKVNETSVSDDSKFRSQTDCSGKAI